MKILWALLGALFLFILFCGATYWILKYTLLGAQFDDPKDEEENTGGL